MAHSFRPTDGRFHLDADQNWVVGTVPGSYDMQTVALQNSCSYTSINYNLLIIIKLIWFQLYENRRTTCMHECT